MGDRYDSMGATSGKTLLSTDEIVETVDIYSGAVHTESDDVYKLNRGVYFQISDIDEDIDSGSPKYWLIEHDGSDIHANIELKCNANGIVELFESPTITADGSSITIYNSNRTSTVLPTVGFFSDPTVTDDGTRLAVYQLGVEKKIGGAEAFTNWILNTEDKDYIVKLTTDSDNARATFRTLYHIYAERWD